MNCNVSGQNKLFSQEGRYQERYTNTIIIFIIFIIIIIIIIIIIYLGLYLFTSVNSNRFIRLLIDKRCIIIFIYSFLCNEPIHTSMKT